MALLVNHVRDPDAGDIFPNDFNVDTFNGPVIFGIPD
jgi:hypothetical protein